jgi:hypothetical protein
MSEYIGPSYTRAVFDRDEFPHLVERFAGFIAKHPAITALAACGNSGVPLAAALAYKLGLGLIVVRKPHEQLTHDGKPVTGYAGPGKFLVVDDCIDSGDTVRHIVQSISSYGENHGYGVGFEATPYAIALYGGNFGTEVRIGEQRVPVFARVGASPSSDDQLATEMRIPPVYPEKTCAVASKFATLVSAL